ncbi:TonB-dependent receptor plug domain-containing protein [Rubricoccus marinus]|uniref:TonB-dependent receptor n=1 Tax=Rubricoccus marinus TaxID=716817 RepID=A0A259TUR7_9BACT|nr:TonB-dependent receptor [Rubricoccus marinus]OZC01512.1 hypothetical protein BSZ36_00025 [Rubricoccus marinus]
MRTLFALALLLASGARAQPADSVQAGDLGSEVVVTASRLLDAARQTGRHTTVITEADIAQSPARSVSDLLRFAAGVETASRGDAQADISVRGATFNGVLFLVDGARFNDPMTGHFLSDFPIPLAEIARIEILRGPASAVYGPDALGGVVHVITKTALAKNEGGASGEVGIRNGDPDLWGFEAAARGRSAARAWSVAYEGLDIGGEPIRDAEGAPIVGSGGEVRTDLSRHALTLAGATDLGGARLTARLAGDTRHFNAFQYYTPFASDSAREATSTAWAQLGLAGASGATRWRVQSAGRLHRDRYTYYPGLAPNTHVTARGTLTADASREVRGGLTLGAGASGEVRGIDSNNQGAHTDASGGVFALARWQAARGVTLTASGRVDADPIYGIEPTPMLSLAWEAAPALTLRASGGRAVRAPTYVERYFNTEAPRPGGNLGNPDLRAERAWNAEAGADLFAGAGLALRATGFWRRTTDLIDFARLSPEAEFFLAQNVLEARAAGFELHAEAQREIASGATLRAEAAYTYTDIQLDGTAPGAVYKYALSHSPHLVQARLSLGVGTTRLGVDGLWKERLDLPSVAVADVQLSFAVPVGGARGEVQLSVRNVTNAQYAEVFGAPMPGRAGTGGVRLLF